jgi:ribosome-associated protein
VPRIGEDPEAVERSRTSMKWERVNNETALAELAQELIGLNEEMLSSIGVPERALETLRDARKIKTHSARARHLRLVRATLRSADWMDLRRRLDLRKMGILAAPSDERVSEWCEQLLIQGDPGLARFMEEFPNADRKRLRQLMRIVRAAPIEKRGKARMPLEQAIIHVIHAHAEDAFD